MNKKDEQRLVEILKDAIINSKSNSIENCSFVGVQYDAKAVSAIETIATGLVENAKALGALAAILKASNVELQSFIRIDGSELLK